MSTLITKRYVLCLVVVWCFVSCNASRVVKGSNARGDALRETTLEGGFAGRHLQASSAVWFLPPGPVIHDPAPITEGVEGADAGANKTDAGVKIAADMSTNPPPNDDFMASISCVKRSNVGDLCTNPQSSPAALKHYVDGAGYGNDVIYTVHVLLHLVVPFEIETDGVKFVLPNVEACLASTEVEGCPP